MRYPVSMILAIFCVLVSFITIAACTPAAAQNTGVPISEIQIQGVERIEPSTVMTYLDLRVSDRMTQENLDRALKSLFGTGLFADVSLQPRGNILVVQVVENPLVNQIAFEGNDKLSDEELKSETNLRTRQVFTRTKVQADVNRLYQLYQRNGRFSANIDPKVIKLDQNRVNLVYEIDEGPVTKVKSIRFVGNQRYDDDKLRGEIITKEAEWYRFLAANDRYDPDRLAFDQELLRRFYLSQGYADFQIISANAELSGDRKFFYITFTLDEGDRYKVGSIDIVSDLRDFDESVLRPYVTFEEGQWYDAGEIRTSIDKITDALGDMQYAFVNIRPDLDRDREADTVDVTFFINETPRVYVERIDIRGNVRTLDRVIRRELELVEGDPFNKSKLARSEQEIRDLGYFESVEVTPLKGSAADKTVIDIEVSEQSTGELSLGAGFSTTEGPLADFRIRERNLLGKGQELLLAATIAGERTEFDLGFTEPYFMGRDFSVGFDAFHVTRDYQDESSFDQRRTGGAIRVGYPLSEKWRQLLRYRLERNEIEDVSQDASTFISSQEGNRTTSAISQRLTFDDRDSRLQTTNGTFAWLDTEFAGLGGNAEYLSGRMGASYFYPVADQWVLNILGETGGIVGLFDSDVRINERYYLGGSTLRGFEDGGVGPRDLATDDALGGNFFYRGTVELSFPTFLPEELGVRGHVFNDFGSLWDIDDDDTSISLVDEASVRASAGVGVSWRSPLGPIRIDVAAPYLSEDFDREEALRFNFGTRF